MIFLNNVIINLYSYLIQQKTWIPTTPLRWSLSGSSLLPQHCPRTEQNAFPFFLSLRSPCPLATRTHTLHTTCKKEVFSSYFYLPKERSHVGQICSIFSAVAVTITTTSNTTLTSSTTITATKLLISEFTFVTSHASSLYNNHLQSSPLYLYAPNTYKLYCNQVPHTLSRKITNKWTSQPLIVHHTSYICSLWTPKTYFLI